jgi:hypothetical protein
MPRKKTGCNTGFRERVFNILISPLNRHSEEAGNSDCHLLETGDSSVAMVSGDISDHIAFPGFVLLSNLPQNDRQ